MTTNEILALKDHRTWPYPSKRWSYYQEWNDALFLHWEVDPEDVRSLIGREPDLFEDKAWVSFVAFDMNNVHPRGFPCWEPFSNFHELNIRTYTRHEDKSGVHFFSLEGSKKMAATVARKVSSLPYRYSEITRQEGEFSCNNSDKKSSFNVSFTPGNTRKADELDRWLTEHYALIQLMPDRTIYFDIHHGEWPVQEVSIDKLKIDYPKYNHLIQGPPIRMHYSPGVQVLSWSKQLIK